MAKVRCASCRAYVDKQAVYRRVGLSSVCSEQCFARLREDALKRRSRSVSEQRTDGDIPVEVRERVMLRDRGCCYCGGRTRLHVHHITYRSQGGAHHESNLLVLCESHHALVHSDKPRFAPLCRGVVWSRYQGRRVLIPHLERRLSMSGLA